METETAGSEVYYRQLYDAARQEGAKLYDRAAVAAHCLANLERFSRQLHITAQNEIAMKTFHVPVPQAISDTQVALKEIVLACQASYELHA
jgi:hypothetical protein